MTACKPCRSAKVRCNGKRICERCKNRNLRCTYNPVVAPQREVAAPASSRSKGRDRNRNRGIGSISPASTARSCSQVIPKPFPAEVRTTSDGMPVDMSGESFTTSPAYPITVPLARAGDEMEHWSEETFNNALKQFDWVFPEPGIDFGEHHTLHANGLDLLHGSSDLTGQPQPPDMAYSTASDMVTIDAPNEHPQAPESTSSCQCRAQMMAHIPSLEATIRELPKPQLDKMFKITGDVIRSCQMSMRCGCHAGPVDLVCTMAAFEQTAVCFDYIAKSGFDGPMKVGIGSYSMALDDDARVKRMLVLDLVGRADELLDSVSARARDMHQGLEQQRSAAPGIKRMMGRSPTCLNQLNLNYVHEAIASFKKLFRLIREFFGEKDSGTADPGTRPES